MVKITKKTIYFFIFSFVIYVFLITCFISKIKQDINFAKNYPETIVVENNKTIEEITFDRHKYIKVQELNDNTAVLSLFNKIKLKEIKIKRLPEKEVYIGGDIVACYSDGGINISTVTYYEKNGKMSVMGHGNKNIANSTDLYSTNVVNIIRNSSKSTGYLEVSQFLIEKVGLINPSVENIREMQGVSYNLPDNNDKYLLAFPYEINSSPAKIIIDLDGNGNKEYNIKIDEIIYSDKGYDFCFTITDLRLLFKTNGIIHGMSGAPIVQNGKIIGSLHGVDTENHKHGYASFVVF